MTPIILDLAALAILVVFALLGRKKGLVLSLCGLLAFLLAFCGATFVSTQFGDTVSGIIQPYVQLKVENVLEESLLDTAPAETDYPAPTYVPTVPGTTVSDEDVTADLTLDEVLGILKGAELFADLQEALENAVRDGTLLVVTTASSAIAVWLAGQIARTALFFLSFFLLLLVWWLISHALDLACRLPVLRTLNGLGGLVIGLAKGMLLLLVLSRLLASLDVVPTELAQSTYLYRFFLHFQLF